MELVREIVTLRTKTYLYMGNLAFHGMEILLQIAISVVYLRDWLDPANINPQTWNGIGVINASPSISGSTVVCNQETYTIQNLPSGVSVQWSTSNGNLQLISGQGARTAVFRKNGSGECMIRARIASSTITYRVWAGVPSRVDYIEGMREGSQFKPNSTYVFSIENDPNSDNVTWAVGGGQIESGQGTNQIFVKTSDAGRFFIWARKRNRCGTGGATDLVEQSRIQITFPSLPTPPRM